MIEIFIYSLEKKIICCNSVDFNYSLRTLVSILGDLEWPSVACIHGSRHAGFYIMIQINHVIPKGANNLN